MCVGKEGSMREGAGGGTQGGMKWTGRGGEGAKILGLLVRGRIILAESLQ